ncbi:MAG: S-layer homology domain-containing protein, partial [Clostridia bacterium]|nr:S-layer homology domain-containing protein [Clostridia bacterium]
KLDNIVYTTTADIYEQIKNEDNPDEPPVMGSDKPIDYNKVLVFEDFEGDTAPDSANFDWKPAQKVSIVSDSSDTVSAKEQGSYVRIDEPTDVVDGYYRVKYGANTAPVQASGTKVADLSRMQISLDWCPIVARSYGIRFFDKFSDAAATKAETLINVNQDGTLTFPNSDVTYSYSMGRWMAIDTYLDFTTDKYSIYINGNKVVTEAKLSTLTECAEAVGATITAIKAGETYSMGLDNIRIAIPEKMAVTSATPANGADDVNVKDGVQLTLTNVPVNFDKSMVTVTGGTTAPSYTASIQDNVISVAFDGAMEFGTQYTVTLSGDIADDFGQTLGTDYTVTFTTSDVEFAASVPQFGSKVTASAFNPYDEAKTAALVVSVINADGSSTLYIDEKTVEAGATADFTADFDITSLTDGQTVIAYVTEDTDSLKPVRSMYASADGTAVFAGSTAAAATVDKAEIVGNTVKVEGKISAKEQQTVILTVSDEAGNAAKAVPLTTAADGSFTYTYTIDGMQPGKYIVSVTGFSITESNSVGYMYLNDETKNEINAAINGAADAAAVKAQMEKYKNELYLPEKYYCDNIYNVLAQQKPFADYDSMTEMIYKADSLLTELNNADWSKYTKLFADYEDIMLKGADKLDKYNGYSAIKQNAINQIIIESSPFASFAALCTAFDAAVKEYGDSSSSGGSGGGGSGGSGGSSSSSVGGGSSSYNVGTTQIAAAETLFADMSAAPWAQQHVTQLYTKGIVSAAVNYRPLDNITREEFVKMLVQLAGLTTDSSKPSFTDVNGSEWYVPYLAAAQKAGIVQGSDDGSFGIGKNITRQDMVVMAQRTVAVMNKALKLTNEAVNFADSSQISGYAASAVTEMQQAGVVSGMGNGCFEPTGLANRAQAAVVICNLINAME